MGGGKALVRVFWRRLVQVTPEVKKGKKKVPNRNGGVCPLPPCKGGWVAQPQSTLSDRTPFLEGKKKEVGRKEIGAGGGGRWVTTAPDEGEFSWAEVIEKRNCRKKKGGCQGFREYVKKRRTSRWKAGNGHRGRSGGGLNNNRQGAKDATGIKANRRRVGELK